MLLHISIRLLPLQAQYQWTVIEKNKTGESKTINYINVIASAARSRLGDCPNKDSAAYKNLIAKNYDQWVRFSAFLFFQI